MPRRLGNRMSRKWVVIAGSLVVIVGVIGIAGATGVFAPRTPAITYLTAIATKMDVRDSVAVSGSVRPVDDYALAFGSKPRRTAGTTSAATSVGGSSGSSSSSAGSAAAGAQTWTVASVTATEGKAVRKGDVLAAADTADAQQSLAIAQSTLTAAQARLTADQTPVTENSKARAKLAVTQAQLALDQARTALTQTKAASSLSVSQASAALQDAKDALARDTLAGALPPVLAADHAAITAATRALATVGSQTQRANTQAANAVAAATLALTSANLAYAGATGVDTTALVEADKANVVKAQAAVDDAQKTLDLAVIRAPIDGIVSKVSIRVGDIASGTVIRVRSAAVEITASVTESDLPRLGLGQPADVAIASLGAKTTGSVSSIDLANPTKSASGIVSYDLVIAVPAAPDGIAPGMTASIDITTSLATGVVAVPASAIGGVPGAYTLQVLTAPNETRTVSVVVGLLTAEYAEIKSGIDAGAVVVTGTVSAKDLVQTFPTGPGGATATAAPTAKP